MAVAAPPGLACATAAAGGGWVLVWGIATLVSGCGWYCGGVTICPGGVPGASVGGPGPGAGWVTLPVNACWSSGAILSERPFCT